MLVKVVRVRKVLDPLGSLIRALRDLKTTILVVALFGRFCRDLGGGCHRGAYHLLSPTCYVFSYNSYNVSIWLTFYAPRV